MLFNLPSTIRILHKFLKQLVAHSCSIAKPMKLHASSTHYPHRSFNEVRGAQTCRCSGLEAPNAALVRAPRWPRLQRSLRSGEGDGLACGSSALRTMSDTFHSLHWLPTRTHTHTHHLRLYIIIQWAAAASFAFWKAQEMCFDVVLHPPARTIPNLLEHK